MINDNSSPEARARYARLWHGLPPTQEQRAAQRAKRYSDAPSKSLSDYASAQQRSPHEQRPNESDPAYVARLQPLLKHLAAASFNAAVERLEGGQTYDQLREHLDRRASGITGQPTRTLDTISASYGLVNTGGEPPSAAASPGVPMSSVEAMAIVRQREQAMRGQEPQRVDLSAIRSSGSDFLGIDR